MQVGQAQSFNDMRVMAQSGASAPYSFDVSSTVTETKNPEKMNMLSKHYGREGNVHLRDANFYIGFADITSNGSSIKFISADAKPELTNAEVLSSLLESKPFTLNETNNFHYSVKYGIGDTSKAASALREGEYINFKVELVDVSNGAVLGVYDNVRYDKDHVLQYKNIGYEVSSQGIGSKQVKLRLTVETNCDSASYSMSQKFSNTNILARVRSVAQNYKGNLSVKEYALLQNYPNPFNPNTTIRFDLPKDCNVSLKIYGILGNEVVTLVNEFRQAGQHSVNFNAANLSSGVYIYKINSGKFTAAKKLMFIK